MTKRRFFTKKKGTCKRLSREGKPPRCSKRVIKRIKRWATLGRGKTTRGGYAGKKGGEGGERRPKKTV